MTQVVNDHDVGKHQKIHAHVQTLIAVTCAECVQAERSEGSS